LFYGNDVDSLNKKFTRISRLSGLERLTAFWLTLNELATGGKFTLLASQGYVPSLNKYNVERINKVFEYVSSHFYETIKLSDIASLVHMTETSFSRFFKQITGEPFIDYLNNTRISHACVLLAGQMDKSISEIMAESGFRSSTHFNRMFLQKKGCTPGYFRKQYRG
jgi:AraC-like DNA-binding protein